MAKPNLKTSSGQTIHHTDTNYDQFKADGATEIEAPTVPSTTVAPSPVVSTEDLTSDISSVETQSNKQQKDLEGVQNTLKDTSVYGKVATPGFINAAFNAKYGRDVNEGELGLKTEDNKFGLQGATVKDVIGRLGLDQHLQDYGMGGVKDTNAGVQDNGDGGGDGSGEEKPTNEITSIYDDLINYKTENMKEMADVNSAQAKVAQAKIDTEEARQNLRDFDLERFEEVAKIENQPVAMSFIKNQIVSFDKDRQLDIYMAGQQYNDALILQNLASGNLQEAQRINQQVMNDRYQIMTLSLDKAKEENRIDELQYNRAIQQAEQDLTIQNDYGYTPVSKDAFEVTKEQFGLSRMWQDPVSQQWYLKPDENTQIVSTINVDGHLWGLNKNGDKVKDYGSTTNFNFDQQDDGSVLVTNPATGEVIRNESPTSADLSIGSGTITGMNGSELWKHGLDFVLDGGKGASVKSPFMGEVIFAGKNGGFGNQVKLDMGDGTELWLSHLDDIMVEVGDFVGDQMIIGSQGNSGDVYSLTGGDGTHLDITMKKPDGGYYKPQEVASLLGHKQEGGNAYEQNILTARLGKQIYGTRISDAESKRVQSFIEAGMAQGKDQWDIIDDVIGYQIDEGSNKALADGLKNLLLQNTGESGLAGFDMLGLARLINDDNREGAITKTENMIYANARKTDPEGFISESKVKSAVEKGKNLTDFVNQLEDSPVGIVEGNIENWLGKLKGKEATQIKSQIVNLVAKMRNDLLGSAVTETEEKFLEPLIPALNDTPANFMAKIEQLQTNPLLELNNYRDTFGLAQLDNITLFDRNLRADSYTTEGESEEANNNDPLGIL